MRNNRQKLVAYKTLEINVLINKHDLTQINR